MITRMRQVGEMQSGSFMTVALLKLQQ
jgi:hypothetical protein